MYDISWLYYTVWVCTCVWACMQVDSLLTQRSSDESEASRRIKTEFLVQLDGAGGGGVSSHRSSRSNSNTHGINQGQAHTYTDNEYLEDARVVVIGATNRPDELDEAARRRFAKRLYIPLPNEAGRSQLVEHLLEGISHSMSVEEQTIVVAKTAGFSGADIKNLCTEASLGPVRDLASQNVHFMQIQGILFRFVLLL
jgi:SpoVK/Ycf46/Vps4 family AAA+-type ATPase